MAQASLSIHHVTSLKVNPINTLSVGVNEFLARAIVVTSKDHLGNEYTFELQLFAAKDPDTKPLSINI